MQATQHPWRTHLVDSGRPTVGDLMSLCEENYSRLLRLIPDLRQIRGEELCVRDRGQDLHLEILEQSRYTTLLRLTYYFSHNDGLAHRIGSPDPDVLLRAYHDAGQVEVLSLRQTALPLHNHYRFPALEAKWKVNLFLSKWLIFCCSQGYRFTTEPRERITARGDSLAPILP